MFDLDELKQLTNAVVYLCNKAEARADALPEGDGKEAMSTMRSELAALAETMKAMLHRATLGEGGPGRPGG